MDFWKRFFIQPALWPLAAAIILLSSLAVHLTPQLLTLTIQANPWGLGWSEQSLSYDEFRGGNNSEGWWSVDDFLADYSVFSGGFRAEFIQGGQTVARANYHYHTGAAAALTAILFLGIIIITRRSNNVIFILGPLLIGWIVAVIVMTMAATQTFDPSIKADISVFPMLFNWLILNVSTSVAVWWIARYILLGRGLIRGIDEEGPLDFSGLKQAAVITTSLAQRGVDQMGRRLQQAIKEETTKTPSASPTTTSGAQAPTSTGAAPPAGRAIGNLANYCHLCGGHPLKGWGEGKKCPICRSPVGVVIPKPDLGLCPNCDSPKAYRATFCYRCGLRLSSSDDI